MPICFCTYALTSSQASKLPFLVRKVAPHVDAFSITLHTGVVMSELVESMRLVEQKQNRKKTRNRGMSFFYLPGGSRFQRQTLLFESMGKPLALTYMSESVNEQNIDSMEAYSLQISVNTAFSASSYEELRCVPFSLRTMVMLDPSLLGSGNSVTGRVFVDDDSGTVVTCTVSKKDDFEFGSGFTSEMDTSEYDTVEGCVSWRASVVAKLRQKTVEVSGRTDLQSVVNKNGDTTKQDTKAMWVLLFLGVILVILGVVVSIVAYQSGGGPGWKGQGAQEVVGGSSSG